jgi:hypothetical protein
MRVNVETTEMYGLNYDPAGGWLQLVGFTPAGFFNLEGYSLDPAYEDATLLLKMQAVDYDSNTKVRLVGQAWSLDGEGNPDQLVGQVQFRIGEDTTDDGTPTYLAGGPLGLYAAVNDNDSGGPSGYESTLDMDLDDFYARDGLAGDFNLDGSVDTADYTIWADNYTGNGGTGRYYSQGDANLDGSVDTADYTVWADSYTGTSVAVASVPEPVALTLLSLGAWALLLRRRSR